MRKKRFLVYFTIWAFMFFGLRCSVVFADVGSFESYDSGSSGSSWSSSSSSDWSSSSSYSSSSWDDDDYYWGGGSGSILSVGSYSVFLIIIVVAIVLAKFKNSGYNYREPVHRTNTYTPSATDEAIVESKIKAIDPLFNKEEFLSWAKNLFVKLQEAWTARDWSTIRTFETNELFEQHRKQLQGYIDAKQINVMERICVKSAYLSDFKQVGDKDVLTITLSSKMVDYIIDENTNKIIKGDKMTDRHSTYKMVFVRKTGIKTEGATGEVKTTNCPNCGAPTEITSSGKCEYCGSVITTDEHDWALSSLEKVFN